MSDDVKDFAYYASAAERVIATVEDGMPAVEVAAIAAIAQVLATLAAGAPKAGPCPVRLNSNPPSTVGLPCTLLEGHSGDHKDYRGVYFVS